MNLQLTHISIAFFILISGVNGADVYYSQDFENVSDLPKDFVVMDGKFYVKEINGNKVLELQGIPLDNYGLFFGPEISTGVELTVRIRSEATGKRYPSFCIGLNGSAGFKLRVSPGRRIVELLKGDEIKASTPFKWKDKQWMFLRLRSTPISQEKGLVCGSVWYEGDNPPLDWQVKLESDILQVGKASLWGIPYSSKPIQIDDIVLKKI